MVRARGLEPPRPFGHWLLRPARLPVPPRPQGFEIKCYKFGTISGIDFRKLLKYNDSTMEPKSSDSHTLSTTQQYSQQLADAVSHAQALNHDEIGTDLVQRRTASGPSSPTMNNKECSICTTVLLTRGYHALVSLEDIDRVSQIKWRVRIDSDGRPLAVAHKPGSGKRGKEITLHRFIVDAQPGQIVDHINGDTLDDRRSNLRVCRNAENIRNQRPHRDKRTSKLKGVYFQPSRRSFRAQITVDRRKINLGNYPTEVEAAHAYDNAARRHFGDFARLNFQEEL